MPGIVSLSAFILWKRETFTQVRSFLGNAHSTQSRRPDRPCCGIAHRWTEFLVSARLWLCPSPRVIKNNGYSNERVLVQKRAGHFSRPSKCWCWKDTKHRLSAGHRDRLCRWEISLCWVKAHRWRERRRRRRRWSQPVGQICTVSVHCYLFPPASLSCILRVILPLTGRMTQICLL